MCKVVAINPRGKAVLPQPFALRKGNKPSEAAFGTVIASYTNISKLPKDGFVIAVPAGRCGSLTCPKRREQA